MVGFVALLGAYVTTGQIIPEFSKYLNSSLNLYLYKIFYSYLAKKFINLLIACWVIKLYFADKKTNKVIALSTNINPKYINANFLPINAVSGSSFTLIIFCNYLIKITLFKK